MFVLVMVTKIIITRLEKVGCIIVMAFSFSKDYNIIVIKKNYLNKNQTLTGI